MRAWHNQMQRMIDEIDACIRAHEDEKTTLDALSRSLGYSAFYISRRFREISGMQFRDYLRYRRLAFALEEVRYTQRGLLEIPRELPGVVGVFVIAALPSLGNVSLSVLGFALYCVGLLVLGLFSPGYFVMQLFVFT